MSEKERLDLYERLWTRLCLIQGKNGLSKEDVFKAFDEIYDAGFQDGAYCGSCDASH